MKKIIVFTLMVIGCMSVKAQFPTTDSLRSFINRYIRNSAVEAFQNLRLNTALIGISNYIDSAYGGQVVSFTAANDSTARLVTLLGDTMDVVIRGTGGVSDGDKGDITVSVSGATWTINDNAVTYSKIQQSAALSVIGNSTNSTANVADIAAGSDNQVLRRSGTGIGFGAVNLASSNAVTGVLPVGNTDTSSTNHLLTQSDLNDTSAALRAAIGSGGGGQTLVSDLGRLPVIKQNFPAQGISASGTTVTNYPVTALDSNLYYFTTTNNFATGTKFGGVLWSTPIGDSVQISAPFGVLAGSSFCEGHRLLHGREHPPVGTFVWNYPDSVGQMSYHLRELTNMRWYNQAIGGQTSEQMRIRWARDVLGQTLTADPGDGRGTKTLSHKPLYVIYDGIGNDPYFSITPQQSMDNLRYFAQSCYDNGIKLIVCNSPTGLLGYTTAIQHHATVNKWLESGALDQYGAVVFDLKSYWSDPAYGYDGVHGNPALIDPFDGIHFTKAGYDSLSHAIFNVCKLPKVTKIAFINKLAPSNPITNYAYVDSLSISSVGYQLSKQSDTVDVRSPLLTDSIWITAKHITTVAGAGTQYGYGHIDFILDNNIANDSLYTRRTQGSNGANSQYMKGASLDIVPETYNSNAAVIDVRGATLARTDHAFTVHPAGAGGYSILNGGSTNNRLNLATLSIYGTTGIGMNGNIIATGTNHQFGNFQLTYNIAPSNVGWGLCINHTAVNSRYAFMTVAGTSMDQFSFREWSNTNTVLGSSGPTNIINIAGIGFRTPGTTFSVGTVINAAPEYNITGGNTTGTAINGFRYKPILTSLTNTRHKALLLFSGNNYLNADADSTCIGCDSASFINAKFRVNGSVRIDGLAAPSSYNLMVHSVGSDSLVGQAPVSIFDTRPSLKITGETTAGDGNPAGITMYGRTATIPTSGYSYGVQDFSFVTANSGFKGYLGFESWPYVTGNTPGSLSGKFGGYVNSFSAAPLWDGSTGGSHQLPVLLSYFSGLQTQAGGVQDAYDNYASEINSVGGTTLNPAVTNHYAFYAEPFIYATNNYGIYINGKQSNYFGGSVQIDSSLYAKAGSFNKVRTITADATINVTDNTVLIDATSGNVTVTLPAASAGYNSTLNVGITYKFQRIDNSGNTVTIQRAGSDTINGTTSYTLTTQYQVKQTQATSTTTWAQW